MGVFIILPPYLPQPKPLATLLFFDVKDVQNLPQWCNDLSDVLQKKNIQATIFVAGKVAEKYPACVSKLAERNDVGSITYDYIRLGGTDYTTQLTEVKNGKDAVDRAGHIDSKLFKAPYGSTDENIYSILSRSGILADFSYEKQYNKFYNGTFIKFDDSAYDGTEYTAEYFHNISINDPIIINFDNATPVQNIDDFISHLKSRHILLLSASQLTGINLTVHQEQKI